MIRQTGKFVKTISMAVKVEDLYDESRFRHLLTISYSDILPFILDHLKRKTIITVLFWLLCVIFLGQAILILINISKYSEYRNIFIHTVFGLIAFPILVIPIHEFVHIITYFFLGARNIRFGMDLSQYIFYVTAHRFVCSSWQFRLVAITPFILISLLSILFLFSFHGIMRWSLSLFLFVHTTMCAGDFAMLNYYYINKFKRIYSWDDVEVKKAYFYQELN